MMFTGNGLLALWNGVEASRAAEYDLWHTREHVPERLAVPRMLSARRYVGGRGDLPQYLTLYDVEDTDVFTSQPYRALLENPTDWSRSMRPSFHGFFRLACRPLARVGGGIGGALLATTLTTEAHAVLAEDQGREVLRQALAIPAVTVAHIAVVAPEIPAVSFQIGGTVLAFPHDAVLLLEGYDRAALEAAASAVGKWFETTALGQSPTVWTSYSLGYLVGQPDLAKVVPATRTHAAA